MGEKSDVKSWFSNEGAKFLRKIVLKPGKRVVDFGCGSGHYSIPAARAVGKGGKIYAMEEDGKMLAKLKKRMRLECLDNMIVTNSKGKLGLDVPAASIDVILAYDVLHYFHVGDREKLYREFRRILKGEGLLSVYPKHYRDDFPLREFAHLSLEQIVTEIEKSRFSLREIRFEKLIHDDSYNHGYILNFKLARKTSERRKNGDQT